MPHASHSQHSSATRRVGLRLAAMVFAAGLAGAGPAFADGNPDLPGIEVSPALIAEVADWIQARSNLPLPERLPEVRRMSREDMARVFAGETPGASSGRQIEALYDSRNTTILLAPDWNPERARDISVLLHEMVHHMQFAADAPADCPAARERTAYDLQTAWLEEHDLDLFDEFELNGLTLMILTTCGV